jgi:beta-glucosidase
MRPLAWLSLLLLPAVPLLGCGQCKCTKVPEAPKRPFFWATATAAYQVEGGLHGTDWHQWEYQPDGGEFPPDAGHIAHNDHADQGDDEYEKYAQDFDLAQQLGTNAMRISIEWARVEPTEGHYDAEAIAHYHAVLKALRDRHITPMVTLQHFSLPLWIHDCYHPENGYGGWAGRDGDALGEGGIVSRFARFAGDMAQEFGGEVDDWFTINEPMGLVTATYVNPTAEQFPHEPFESDLTSPIAGVNLGLAVRATMNMISAHARAYDAIHQRDTVDADGDGVAASVSIAHHVRAFLPSSHSAESVAAAEQLQYLNNELILNALVRGDVDLDFDGRYDGPGEAKGREDLRGRLDFLGLNYYTFSEVAAVSVGNDAGISIPGLPLDGNDYGYPVTDLGWPIYPQGLHDLVTQYAADYGLPVLISENGVADSSDAERARFLVQHVKALKQAQSEGVRVLGYTYWSLVDNFEWAKGFAPRFGLYHVDYATGARTPTRGVDAYKAIVAAGGVTAEIEQAYDP